MDKKISVSSSSSSSSSSSASSFDHIFGPRVTSSSSSSSTGLFKSIFPPPSIGAQPYRNEAAEYQPPNSRTPNERGDRRKNKETKTYQNEETHPPCNLSSSIYYGGQDNYSSSTPPQSITNPDPYKKDGEEGDPGSASRGNWWEASLQVSSMELRFHHDNEVTTDSTMCRCDLDLPLPIYPRL